MRNWAIDLLRCPQTGLILKLKNHRYEGEHIMEGVLVSENNIEYPIVNGVPRLILDFQNRKETKTAKAFGEEWAIFNKSTGYLGSKELFFDFMRGLNAGDFKNKLVLDAGCGNGRWTKVISEFNCKYIVAMDFSDSVDFCFRNTRDCDNVVVVQGSIYNPPLPTGKFDLALSIGVVDHLLDPQKGLEVLKSLLHKDGELAFWVYALEGNELYLKLAKPLRVISTKLPRKMLLAISLILSLPVWFHSHTLNKKFGFNKNGNVCLPMADYFSFLENFKYIDIVNIAYDQLTPALAHYIPKDTLIDWLNEAGLEVKNFVFRNRNSFSVLTKPLDKNE
ncbi:MAG: class I SAM-dependent methyltransferase [bacterium]